MSLASALRTRDLADLPSRRDEDWRWTDLRGLIRALPAGSPALTGFPANSTLDGLKDPRIVYVNGRRLEGDEIAIPATGQGTFVRRFISVSDGTAHHLQSPVEVGQTGRLTLIDSFEGRAAGYVADASCVIRVGEGAVVDRIVLLGDAADAVSVSLTEVELSPGAIFRQTVLASGAKRQRFETRVRHLGGGASVQLDGVYVLEGQRHSDQTTLVVHEQPHGETRQLTKGVAQDQARGVFQGRIVVAQGADGADARMGHHALILSDRAEIDAKPELEIYADDVACAHGNTVGALDQDALFYALSRGIPEAEARALLIGAFLGEVVDRIAHEPSRDLARTWLAARLGATA